MTSAKTHIKDVVEISPKLPAAKRIKVLTWHIHGSYLYYLTRTDVDWYLPKGDGEGYGGRTSSFEWGDNVHDVPVDEVKNLALDCIIFQSAKNYQTDQYQILSPQQRQLPRLYIEHDPPQESPTNTRHYVDDPDILLVHVTDFNNLMWDNNRTPTTVIDHGVTVPEAVRYSGELAKGLVVVNNIHKRGRRLGLDVFEALRQEIPLDIVGMGSKEVGGLGEIPLKDLPAFSARYRFFFNPIRYTSMGLAVCEAMMAGLPIIGLATTEMATAVRNGYNGYVETDAGKLAGHMQHLLDDPEHARLLSRGAATYARQRFGIGRFSRDWQEVLRQQTKK